MNKIELTKLCELFQKEYDFLYENYDNVAGYDDAIDAFDTELLQDEKGRQILTDFNKAREDVISSDREAAAFMFALYTLNGGF